MKKPKAKTAKSKPTPEKRKFKGRNEKLSPDSEAPVRKRGFAPKNWDEVETEGVAKTHVFEKKTSKATKKYPPPSTHPTYAARWNEFISDVTERTNFKPGHLAQLDILCRMYVEHDKLTEIVRVEGYVYWSEGGRNGPQLKARPEVPQLNRTRSEIRAYSKTLGLLLVKDTDFGEGGDSKDGEGGGEWS